MFKEEEERKARDRGAAPVGAGAGGAAGRSAPVADTGAICAGGGGDINLDPSPATKRAARAAAVQAGHLIATLGLLESGKR